MAADHVSETDVPEALDVPLRLATDVGAVVSGAVVREAIAQQSSQFKAGLLAQRMGVVGALMPAGLAALATVYYTSATGDACVMEEVNAVFAAKLSLAYHAGVSYLMLRRYKDAIRVLGDMCVQMNRGFTVGVCVSVFVQDF